MSAPRITPGVCLDCGGPCPTVHRTCRACWSTRHAAVEAARTARQSKVSAVALQAPWSPYRCRTHHEQIVTAKGRGCPVCAREAA